MADDKPEPRRKPRPWARYTLNSSDSSSAKTFSTADVRAWRTWPSDSVTVSLNAGSATTGSARLARGLERGGNTADSGDGLLPADLHANGRRRRLPDSCCRDLPADGRHHLASGLRPQTPRTSAAAKLTPPVDGREAMDDWNLFVFQSRNLHRPLHRRR